MKNTDIISSMLRQIKGLYHYLVAVLSAVYFGFPGRKLIVIGVTGTDGKTTTTTLIYEILRKAGVKASMITSVHAEIAGKSYDTGFHVTTPTAYWVQKYLREAVDHGDTHMVLEVTSHGLAQHRVWGIPFAVGVITNVTHEHLDWHRTFTDYLRTKLLLLQRSTTAIVNRDDAHVYNEIAHVLRKQTVVTYGLKRDADITPHTVPFTTKLPGVFNQYNCLAAIGAARSLGIAKKDIQRALSDFRGIPGRMEVIVEKPFRVIVDFAHTPNAITQALQTARAFTKGTLIHVFGSAGLRDHSKRPMMGKASSEYADVIILTEEDYRTEDVHQIIEEISKGIKKDREVHRYPKRAEAIAFALSRARTGDTVIITGKGHEKSLCRGTIEYPWSDQEEVRKALRK